MVLWPYSIHGLGDLGKYNSRPLITYEGKWGILHILFIICIFVERKRNTNNLIFKHYEK